MMISMTRILLPEMDAEVVADEIGDFICKHSQIGAVIGLSGGVDSTVTAALAKRAFDNAAYITITPSGGKLQKRELVGYVLPSSINNTNDTEDAIQVARLLGIRYEVISIEPIVEAYKHTNPGAFESSYDKGNLMSRIRANILSTKSATEKKTLIGTGNKDEDFGIGYYTLFGDGAVHCSPIGNLPKRLVFQMARYLGFGFIADKPPSAGLEPGQTDFGDLGYRYDLVEIVTEGIRQGIDQENLFGNPQVIEVVEDLLNPEFTRVIEDILFRHFYTAKEKADIIHPPIAPITLHYR